MLPPLSIEQTIDRTVREEWGRLLASLVATLRDFQLAEDCLHDAVVSAMSHWRRNGLPRSPAAWLITVARRKALDKLRRDKTFAAKQSEIAYLIELDAEMGDRDDPGVIPDKRLEMIFTCCHPTLAEKSQVALTLRTLGGLSTEEIAAAFLDSAEAMQRRITRAKVKIAGAGIPYEVPEALQLPERTSAVLRVIYLIFNEGYAARTGKRLVRADLIAEAIRLARIVATLLPEDCEVAGLLAMMLLHDARRSARMDRDGNLIPLEHQNRARWDRGMILEGTEILTRVLPLGALGPYQLQAAISAVHAQSPSWAETDWDEISALYGVLYDLQPSAVVRINHAMAVSYAVSVEAALAMLDQVAGADRIDRYQPYHAAMGDLLGRAGRSAQAQAALERAVALTANAQEKRFLQEAINRL